MEFNIEIKQESVEYDQIHIESQLSTSIDLGHSKNEPEFNSALTVKPGIKKEFEGDLSYIKSQPSTSLDLECLKNESDGYNSGFLQSENKMEIMETLIEHSSDEGNNMSPHAEEKTLNQNVKVAIRQRPYKCEICFKQFARKYHLNLHVIFKTKIKWKL
ncbi:uncharacterized protein [Diabrotica undecimpunctata]|uniref:uncharacterized protein isoform X4 n=1 Tax=Diabrotica undecimpunctata TaxID=50387 RepID=UPI003B63BA40